MRAPQLIGRFFDMFAVYGVIAMSGMSSNSRRRMRRLTIEGTIQL
jgi:hypothetical protein